MDIQRVARLTTQGRYEFSDHAERERIHDNFTVADVKNVALRGERRLTSTNTQIVLFAGDQ